MIASTDILPNLDRSGQFCRAEEQERRRRLSEAPQMQAYSSEQSQVISGALQQQQDTATEFSGNQRIAEEGSDMEVSSAIGLPAQNCVKNL